MGGDVVDKRTGSVSPHWGGPGGEGRGVGVTRRPIGPKECGSSHFPTLLY